MLGVGVSALTMAQAVGIIEGWVASADHITSVSPEFMASWRARTIRNSVTSTIRLAW